MNSLKKTLLFGFLGSLIFAAFVAFHPAPPVLANVTRVGNEFKFTNINEAAIKKDLGNGFHVVAVDFHHLENTFYLVRKVVGPNGKTGFLYSEVQRAQDKLLPPIVKIEKFFACWQIASCQCTRPSQYAKCSCNGSGGADGCSTELGPILWEGYFKNIYI
ncbi:MAG: hypothetical protein SF052_02040 [Bacteroidia bacterium]|nr:hypothetical protein [Bacteroidia bacterium]